MFTGIIEEIGKIKGIIHGEKSIQLKIQGKKIFEDLHVGDSIAVNGVCLTVTRFLQNVFYADVMPETLERSSLSQLALGSLVNLERAMSAAGRFGGHMVSGHIDGMGKIYHIEREDNAVWYGIKASPEIMSHIVEKGSVALDGISLTVARDEKDSFYVSVIPHTLEETILSKKQIGDFINIENDMISKYIEKLLFCNEIKAFSNETDKYGNDRNRSSITLDFLKENGF